VLLALLAGLLAGGPGRAQGRDAIAVQATFVPKFPRYVAWPGTRQLARGAPYQLCVIGQDPFGPRLDAAAASERIDGHGVIVRRLPDVIGAEACHLAFVQGRQPAETSRMLFALRTRPVLTITADAGTERGMIHLATIAGRVRFFINEAEATRHGLTISSRLLALAAGVTPRR
jgi:hypothetical protein